MKAATKMTTRQIPPNPHAPTTIGKHKDGDRPIGTVRSKRALGLTIAGMIGGNPPSILQRAVDIYGNLRRRQVTRAPKLP